MNIFKILGDKSWATPGVVGEINDRSVGPGPTAKTGLRFFLAVLTSMFFLFIVGYRMRMQLADWQPLADPAVLWLNTLLLVLSSFALQRAKNAAERGTIGAVRTNLTAAGILTFTFLFGQYFAWQELLGTGSYAKTNPSFAFFFLLTGLHAIHLVGGLYVWARSAFKAWSGMEIVRFKLSIELCTTYWHYLLAVWLVFFILLLST